MNSITKRWVRGSLFFTLLVLLVGEGVFLYYTFSSYYNYVGNALSDQLNKTGYSLQMYAGSESVSEKNLRLIQAVEQFDEKARFEMMLIDHSGRIVLTSSGVVPTQKEIPEDIRKALSATSGGAARFVGDNENGERVMAMTELTPYSSDGIVAMRFVTSLTGIDDALFNMVLASVAFLAVIFLASVISGVYFIRSIVLPLRRVEATAARIAEGDFDNRIEPPKTDDEIGSLCKTINHMADELGRTERMKNEFISSVSHELRTPLTSIKGWADTMGSFKSTDDPGFRRGMEIISGETDRLYDMVEELLDFSRMQNGMVLKPELLDLAAEVEEATLLAGQRAENAKITLAYTAPEAPVPVMADRHRVRQVLLNVLDNALKYSKAGDTVSIEMLQDPKNVFVFVRDEGQGISPEDLENVKMKFYKGKGSVRGSGIGLAVADEIMQRHGGALEISSELGKGTEVSLRFSIHNRAVGEKAAAEEEAHQAGSAKPAPKQLKPKTPKATPHKANQSKIW